MSYLAARPGLSTSSEALTLTNLTNLVASGANFFIQKTGTNTFMNGTLSGTGVFSINGDTSAGQLIVGTGNISITDNGSGSHTIDLKTTAVSASTYTLATITVDQYGRITAASNGSSGSGTVTSVSVTTANGFSGTVANATTTPAITIIAGAIVPNTVVASDATTPHVDTVSGSTNTGYFLVNGKTSGSLKITAADATAQAITLTVAAQTVGAATLTIPNMANTNKTLAWLESPSFTTPTLGVASATTINKVTLTAPATGSTLTIVDGKTLTVNNTITLAAGADSQTFTFPSTSDTVDTLGATQTITGIKTFSPTLRSSGAAAYFIITTPADTGQTASTESIGIKTVTGTRTWATTGTVGLQREIYFAGPTYASAGSSQTFTDATTLYIDKPIAGTNAIFTRGHSLTIVDSTSAASSITGGFVIAATLGTTATSVGIGGGNINAGGTLIVGGHVTFEGVTSTGATGTNLLVFATSPTLTTPVLGAATATSINSLTISTSTGTFTLSNSKTFSVTNTLTLSGTDSTTMTFPGTTATIARTDAAQTFTGTQTFSQVILTANAITASGNAATVPVTSGRNVVTNNSAATLTITMTTSSAVNQQTCIVQILDASAVAQTITWVNTENSGVTAPTTSNGSTSLPLTVGFIYNSGTSKWRCIASA